MHAGDIGWGGGELEEGRDNGGGGGVEDSLSTRLFAKLNLAWKSQMAAKLSRNTLYVSNLLQLFHVVKLST